MTIFNLFFSKRAQVALISVLCLTFFLVFSIQSRLYLCSFSSPSLRHSSPILEVAQLSKQEDALKKLLSSSMKRGGGGKGVSSSGKEVGRMNEKEGQSRLRIAVISDVHMLGYQRRSEIDRKWTDRQISAIFRTTTSLFRPDLFLLPGDVLDENYVPAVERQESRSRFFAATAAIGATPIVITAGNHDVGKGGGLLQELVAEHETHFGDVNSLTLLRLPRVDSESSSRHGRSDENAAGTATPSSVVLPLITVNSMALFVGAPDPLREKTMSFVTSLAYHLAPTTSTGSILVTHYPLYRENDEVCGKEREESGGVTYNARSENLPRKGEVMEKEASSQLLQYIRPAAVISGHTHAPCMYKEVKEETGSEVFETTLSSSSWRMRPDASFHIMDLAFHAVNTTHGYLHTDITMCSLPHEHYLIAVIIMSAVVCAVLVRRAMRDCTQRNTYVLPKKA